jgi:hypothetical protein
LKGGYIQKWRFFGSWHYLTGIWGKESRQKQRNVRISLKITRQTHEQFILNDLSQRRKVHKGHEGEEKLYIKV